MTAPIQDSGPAVDVILRDGATLRLRAPVEGDVPGLVEFFAALSMRSRFLRFHGLADAGERRRVAGGRRAHGAARSSNPIGPREAP